MPTNNIITNFGGATYSTQVGYAPNSFYGHNATTLYITDAAALADGYSIRNIDGSLRPLKEAILDLKM